MSDNEARARELANQICGCADRRQHAADVKLVMAALDAAGRRERIAGLKEAADIVGRVPDNPLFDHGEGYARRICSFARAAISAHLAALSADTPANRGEG